ncbi:hypothetical protein A3F97_00800 [Candidatus Nomurabacteria bacterium RIFCSPLOWO2_12_FULL_41_10]|uniref:Uncharacterized protein n=1 Tax=Candidatus Nomurabacteria bacterium RIFCSPLOWO2_12_FULL_41_10 TaxID=1801795 RepID=A0A1F6YBN0_9BACT|nr:MAG: hypothetical protein A3F97_00800 [Candidatus Nomurabacteria bacterium RIFCSPLOWO2_12_FULL_41_10]
METASQNSLLDDSFLGSRYFDADYLFSKSAVYIKKFFALAFSGQGINLGKAVLFFLAIFFLTIICYTAIRLFEIRAKEKKHLQHEIEKYAHNKAEYEKHLREEIGGSKNERWSKTLTYLFSQHSSDWKLAIIEADSILEDLMGQLGFKGENLGDKLKSANQDNFPLLTTAWEVHTIRNRIAHEGLSFELSHHEAKRVIALYEKIFHGYGYI